MSEKLYLIELGKQLMDKSWSKAICEFALGQMEEDLKCCPY